MIHELDDVVLKSQFLTNRYAIIKDSNQYAKKSNEDFTYSAHHKNELYASTTNKLRRTNSTPDILSAYHLHTYRDTPRMRESMHKLHGVCANNINHIDHIKSTHY